MKRPTVKKMRELEQRLAVSELRFELLRNNVASSHSITVRLDSELSKAHEECEELRAKLAIRDAMESKPSMRKRASMYREMRDMWRREKHRADELQRKILDSKP